MKMVKDILPNVLTEVSAQPTKELQINIKDWARWLNVQTFDDEQIEQMAEACGTFVKLFKSGHKPCWLSLIGKSGVGKTKCARAVWLWLSGRFQWHSFEFVHATIYWPELIRDLRGGERYAELREMSTWPVLFLDDIGAERDTTGFAAEQLNTLLGCRVGKWTILTSNLMLHQLAAIDPRISDRIIREPGNQFVEMTTTSYALRNKP